MKKKGSALIVAMMLIAGIGAVAFGIGRLLFVETTTATLYERGIVAYYAAESGIEEGFLRYKFDRNAMVPQVQDPLLSNIQTNRTNLSQKTPSSSSNFGDLVSTGDDQFYDLHMNYLGTDGNPWLGHYLSNTSEAFGFESVENPNYATGDYASLQIKKDSSAKIDLTNVDIAEGSTKLVLLFEKNETVGEINTDAKKCDAMAELKISIDEGGLGVTRELKELTSFNPSRCSSLVDLSQSQLFPADAGNVSTDNGNFGYIIDLQPMFTRAGYTFLPNDTTPTPVTLTIRPLNYSLRFGMFVESCNNITSPCQNIKSILPGPFTTIKSTGYYGGVTRTLTANVDRQSGTLYDLFDYVIFKEN